jgi:branched-chain amino acid transport system substrate-binding protein
VERRLVTPILVLAAALLLAAAGASAARAPIRIGVLSDCEGRFGDRWNATLGGAITAFSQYTGARPNNPNKPADGMTGGSIAGHPIQIVGYGCSDGTPRRALSETRRLMEQLHAQILIGPVSGDEAIAVADYAKAHRQWTFVNGTSGALETTSVRTGNLFAFNSNPAQWNAGTGIIARQKLKWKTAAVIADDDSFGWTSAAGFIAEFCAMGGVVTQRAFPPLGTTDFAPYIRLLPTPDKVDGYFWAVGGSATLPSLKTYEQIYGAINAKKLMGNASLNPSVAKLVGQRLSGAYTGGVGTAADLKTSAAKKLKAVMARWFTTIPPFGKTILEAGDSFYVDYFNNTWALITALRQVKGDLSSNQSKLRAALRSAVLKTAYGTISLDESRRAIQDQWDAQLRVSRGVATQPTVQLVPQVDASFGGVFGPRKPAPSRTYPPCVKRSLPWLGKAKRVVNGAIG